MRAKRLPRLWCALQGLLPLEQCLAAQEGELGWPRPEVGASTAASAGDGVAARSTGNGGPKRTEPRRRDR